MFVGTTALKSVNKKCHIWITASSELDERSKKSHKRNYFRFSVLPLMVPEPSTFPFIPAFVLREANRLLSVTSRGGISVSVHTTSFILQI